MNEIKKMANLTPLIEVLDNDRIVFLDCETKKQALNILIDNLIKGPEEIDREELSGGIFHREELMSTGIGLGIAVPHVRLESVKNIVMSVGISKTSLKDYESLDGLPIDFIFMIAAGKKQHEKHLKLLSTISTIFKDEKFHTKLLGVKNIDEFYSLLTETGL